MHKCWKYIIFVIIIIIIIFLTTSSAHTVKAQNIPDNVRIDLEATGEHTEGDDIIKWIKEADGTIKKLYGNGDVNKEWSTDGTYRLYREDGTISLEIKGNIEKIYNINGDLSIKREIESNSTTRYGASGKVESIDVDGKNIFNRSVNGIKVEYKGEDVYIDVAPDGETITGGTYKAAFGYTAEIGDKKIYTKDSVVAGFFVSFFVGLFTNDISVSEFQKLYNEKVKQ